MYQALLRFLAVAQKELSGIDARAEIGGKPPTDSSMVYYEAEGQFRVVVLFGAPPVRREALRTKLETLVKAFLVTLNEPIAAPRPVPKRTEPEQRVFTLLQHVVERAGATLAVVVDRRSPVTFGCSLPDAPENVDSLAQEGATELSPDATALQRLARAVHLARTQTTPTDSTEREDHANFILRWFAGIYCLVVAYDKTASELKVESTIIHALPHVEQLVIALPPLEPEPDGQRSARQPFRVV